MAIDLETGTGSTRRVRPQMNITPLVDVVLVLLIIFMVVTPLMTKQLWLPVPPKVEAEAPPPPPGAQPPLVLTVDGQGVTRVNGEVIARADLGSRLTRMLNARAEKVVFFDADSSLEYGLALDVMDWVRSNGVDTLAVLAEENVATASLGSAGPGAGNR